MSWRSRRVRRTRGGMYEIKLPEVERELIANLTGQLKELLTMGPDADPSLYRLFPVAYPENEELEDEYRALVIEELLDRHKGSIAVVEETINATRVDEEQIVAWMGAINDLRLVLGTRLDVTEETGLDFDPTDPNAALLAAYGYLGYLMEEIVQALSGTLPD